MIMRLLMFVVLLIGATFSVTSSSLSQYEVIEKQYLNWVRHRSFHKQSLFGKPKNKLKPCLNIRVNKKPSLAGFSSVRKAIRPIPIINQCRVVISIGAGTYRDKIEVPATMAGAGADKTVIEWDDTADKMGQSDHSLGIYDSATFAINSPYFIAKNITFKNKAPLPPSGALGKQAVALRISADAAAFIGCKFIGAQDTLYDHIGRHYFKDCYIEGSVDFIFGNGRSLYKDCHLHAVTNSYGALTAQKRESFLEETVFSFVNCRVTGSGELYLGRALGVFSRVVFVYTYMDKIITPRGWYDWGDKNRGMTVFYGQYKCSGPGADFGGRVSWARELNKSQAKPFISVDFIDGQPMLIFPI
ncbi:probable pectinesterase 53 [Hibiscus syriacus]|uniref:probable pectinesterase 53 n=1 Tax=Hibiscus syriacus TaxID=106335 RepID=UPI001921269E|nr:probable pectinesterase 53 [Hibiscus syriacus]